MMKYLIPFSILLLLSACSGQSFHEGAKASERFDCANNKPPSQYEDCMQRVDETYKELEKR